MLPSLRIFISCASAEFRSYRDALRRSLSAEDREVKVQEDFHVGGGTLLEKLDDYIALSQAVVHLVGKECGSRPAPREVRQILARHGDLPAALPELASDLDPASCPFTYTQWECFLAIYHRVPCFIFLADDASAREADWTERDEAMRSQGAHVERLRALGQDRAALPFSDAKDVALQVLNARLTLVTRLLGATADEPAVIEWPEVPADLRYDIADRDEESRAFVRMVCGQAHERVLLLHGPSDRGKSTLLHTLLSIAAALPPLRSAHADFKSGVSLSNALWQMTQDLRPMRFPRFDREQQRGAPESAWQAFLQDLAEAQAPVLLAFDTYEQANEEARRWIEQHLLRFVNRRDGFRVVITGQSVPTGDALRACHPRVSTIELAPIADAKPWKDYGHRVMGLTHLSDEQIELLVRASRGSPRTVASLFLNLTRPRV